MAHVETIVKIAYLIGVFFIGVIPTMIALLKSLKSKRLAKTEAEKEVAKTNMLDQLTILIESAEKLYKGVDVALKSQGQSAGPMKKDSVISKLQTYAINAGYTFDVEYWSEKIDELVEFTRNVNAK